MARGVRARSRCPGAGAAQSRAATRRGTGPVVADSAACGPRGGPGGERRTADGAGGEAPVADVVGRGLVGPALQRVRQGRAQSAQRRVAGGGERDGGEEEVVASGQVGAFVGEQRLALRGVERA